MALGQASCNCSPLAPRQDGDLADRQAPIRLLCQTVLASSEMRFHHFVPLDILEGFPRVYLADHQVGVGLLRLNGSAGSQDHGLNPPGCVAVRSGHEVLTPSGLVPLRSHMRHSYGSLSWL